MGPNINYRAEAGMKNEPDTFFVFKKSFGKSILIICTSTVSAIIIGEMEMWRCPDYLFTVAESRGGII